MFDSVKAADSLLGWAGYKKQQAIALDTLREAGINLISDTLEDKFDFTKLEQQLNVFHGCLE